MDRGRHLIPCLAWLAGAQDDAPAAMVLSAGTLYLTGSFGADLTVTGTSGTTALTLTHAGGASDIFLAAFDFSNDHVKWSAALGGGGKPPL